MDPRRLVAGAPLHLKDRPWVQPPLAHEVPAASSIAQQTPYLKSRGPSWTIFIILFIRFVIGPLLFIIFVRHYLFVIILVFIILRCMYSSYYSSSLYIHVEEVVYIHYIYC